MDRNNYDAKIALLREFCTTSIKGIEANGFVRNHPPQKVFSDISSDLIDLSGHYEKQRNFENSKCGHILCGDTRESMAIACLALRLLKPSVVYEIGRFRGWSTTQMCFVIKQNFEETGKKAEFTSIDPHLGADGGPGWSSVNKQCGQSFEWDLSRTNISRASMSEFVETVRGFSGEYIEKVEHDIEFVFVDGDHTYTGAKADVDEYGAKMVQGGLCILHDVWSEEWTGDNYGPSKVYADADPRVWEKVGHMWCVGILRKK